MPRYNLKSRQGVINAKANLEYHIKKGNTIEQKYIRKTRSTQENRALHLYYSNAASALLEIGYNYNYINQMTGEVIEIPFTGALFKEHIWRPLQKTIFKIESTTKLTNPMINDILEVLSNWLAEKGILVKFPNRIDLLIRQYEKLNK
jgi:hypothetical protein